LPYTSFEGEKHVLGRAWRKRLDCLLSDRPETSRALTDNFVASFPV